MYNGDLWDSVEVESTKSVVLAYDKLELMIGS